jgi:ComF family protein
VLTRLWQRFSALLLPSTCFGCETDLPARAPSPEFGLCGACHRRIRWRKNPEYMPGDLAVLYALAEFSGAFRETILHFKYQRRDFLAADFAAQWLLRAPFEPDEYDVIVPVPQSPFKSLLRGYNPPAEVGKFIALRDRKPFVPDALRRRVWSSSQTDKNKADRFRNAKRGFLPGPRRCALKGRSVLLLDDVCTTGATLGECARLLKRLGARRVLASALARDLLA